MCVHFCQLRNHHSDPQLYLNGTQIPTIGKAPEVLLGQSANLWNSLRGERAAWLKNSPTVESFKVNLKNVPLL